MKPAAAALGLTIQETPMFAKSNDQEKNISANAKVREIAFSNDVLNNGNNSDIIQINPNQVAVIRVKSHVLAQVLPLAQVREQIVARLKVQDIDKKTQEFAEDLKNKLQTAGATSENLFNQHHLSWIDSGYVGRHAKKVYRLSWKQHFSCRSLQVINPVLQ